MDIVVPFGLLSPQICARLVVDLIKYLLYVRQQIPSTFEDEKREVYEVKQNAHLDFKSKKIMKFMQQADELFIQLTNALMGHSVAEMAILFGSSTITAKEIYKVSFPRVDRGAADTTEHVMRDYVRKLVRALINSQIAIPNKDLGPTKMFIILKLPRFDEGEVLGFLPKQGLKLKEDKSFVSHIIFDGLHDSEESQGINPVDSIWHQACLSLKGYSVESPS